MADNLKDCRLFYFKNLKSKFEINLVNSDILSGLKNLKEWMKKGKSQTSHIVANDLSALDFNPMNKNQ